MARIRFQLLPVGAPRERRRKRSRESEEVTAEDRWTHLPLDIFSLVAAKTSTRGDYVRFSSACTSYSRFAASLSSRPPRWDVPSLALLHARHGSLVPLTPLHGPASSPSPPPPIHLHGSLVGSSRGFLLLVDHLYRFSLVDPRAGTVTRLPQPHRPSHAIPTSFSLSSSDPADCMALCYCSHLQRLIYWRPGDDCWSLVLGEYHREPHSHVHCRGSFYFVNDMSFEAFVCEMGEGAEACDIPISQDSIRRVKRVAGSHRNVWLAERVAGSHPNVWLAECGGGLMLVVRRGGDLMSSKWSVFRLDMSKEEEAEWVEQSDIGPYALFHDIYDPFSLSTRDFAGLKRNCIYVGGEGHCTIFDIKSRTSEVVYFDAAEVPTREPDFRSASRFWIAPRIMP